VANDVTVAAHGALARLEAQTGTHFPNLTAARAFTDRAVAATRSRLGDITLGTGLSLVFLGSWGRREVTEQSDYDWLLLTRASHEDDHATAMLEELRGLLAIADRGPGSQGLFGALVECRDLVQQIGLSGDDNRNLSRRVLLMLESTPIVGTDIWRACWENVLDGYLDEPLRPGSPPRFFLNDVVRYWRTICVDFVGKTRGTGTNHVMRELKLRTSRKMLFASGLVPLLRCAELTPGQMRPFLFDQLEAPATDRLAAGFLAFDAPDAGVRALKAYDNWIGVLADPERRAGLTGLTREDAPLDQDYRAVRELAVDIDKGLEELLFDTRMLSLTRQHALF
jgi:hypothetical protein